jgi:hypothetical protein
MSGMAVGGIEYGSGSGMVGGAESWVVMSAEVEAVAISVKKQFQV